MAVKWKILFLLLLVANNLAYGQSDIFLTQQWFSRINMNPAATGNSASIDVFLLNRQQWVGFEGAPKTSVVNVHSYISPIRSGLGLSLIYDRLGVSRQNVNAMFVYAFHVDLSEDITLALGLASGIFNSNWDPNRNSFPDDNVADQTLLSDRFSRTSADFNTGMELNGYNITLGASVTHLLNSDVYAGKPVREFYSYLRYRWMINRNLDIAPGVMFRYSNNINFFDFNVTGYFMRNFWVGFSFRPNNAVSTMLGVEFGMFRVGYAYDRSIGDLSSLARNSHEIMLFARIFQQRQERQTTRFLD